MGKFTVTKKEIREALERAERASSRRDVYRVLLAMADTLEVAQSKAKRG